MKGRRRELSVAPCAPASSLSATLRPANGLDPGCAGVPIALNARRLEKTEGNRIRRGPDSPCSSRPHCHTMQKIRIVVDALWVAVRCPGRRTAT
jgi:hypothetical protein